MHTILKSNPTEKEKSQSSSERTTKAKEKNKKPPTASGWKTTYQFLGGAFICLAITGGFEWASRPAPIKEFGRVGEDFYPEFVDPTLATSLEVFAFDADAVKPKEFRVERLDNGRWVIPSHHDYPADAEEQLAKSAASVIGIKRGAMVTRWKADHARYGVVNPKQESLTVDQVDGVGHRLILRGEDESMLADYIIGQQVQGEYDQYYVRHPEEDEVYVAHLDIDLSTKFTDWIDTDLLDLSSGNVLKLTVNDYSFDELSGEISQRDVTELVRDKAWSDAWKLDSLDTDLEELNKDAIRDTLNAIADLEIIGVRPKQQGLTPSLSLDKTVLSSQSDVERLQSDLLIRGFLLQPGEGDDDTLRLIAREGELHAGTDEGLAYRLHFGRVFTGNQDELEVGFTANADSSDNMVQPDSPTNDEPAETDEQVAVAEPVTDSELESESRGKPGRYLFVRVDFDEELLGEAPVKPTEPQKPAKLVEAEDRSKSSDSVANQADTTLGEDSSEEASERSSGDTGDTEGTDNDGTPEGGSETDEADSKENELAELRKKYDEAKKKYDDELKEYEDHQKKVEEGKQKADELNRRFAEWYYVIPGESYETLSLARTDLVQAKEESADGDDLGVDATSNRKAAEAFLAENKSKEGIITTESGLQYEVIAEGEGESPTAESKVQVKYKGTLLDGTVFDESGDNVKEFRVTEVIKGWTEALQLMKPGSKFRLYIPADLAYGKSGSGDKIGPDAALIFDLELVSFE